METKWLNVGYEVQPPQPPHPHPEMRSAAIMPKDDGSELPEIKWLNSGWEVQPIQPPHYKPEQHFAAFIPKDDGSELPLIKWFNKGFEQESGWQPPNPKTSNLALNNHAAAIMVGDYGNEAVFIPPVVNTPTWGFEAPHPVAKWIPKRILASKGRNEFAYFTPWLNFGYEVQSHQPGHPRVEKFGTLIGSDAGSELPEIKWYNFGYDTQSHQSGHPRPERSGSLAVGDYGNENVFIGPAATAPTWGFDIQQTPTRLYSIGKRAFGIEGDNQFVAFNLVTWWETQVWCSKYYRYNLNTDIETGVENVFIPPISSTPTWGYEPQLQPRYKFNKQDSFIKNVENQFVNFYPSGFEVQPYQPQHVNYGRAGNIPVSNVERQFVNWQNAGFEVQPYQPQHIQFAKAGNIPSSNIETPFVNWNNAGWDPILYQPDHPRSEKFGSVVPSANIEAVFVPPVAQVVPFGWEVAPYQPDHPRVEKFGSIVPISNIEIPFINWKNAGFEVQPYQPQHIQYARAGNIPISNIESPFIGWNNAGWEIQPHQPQHQRPERSGSIAPLSNVEFVFTGPPPFVVPSGWEGTLHQPQHVRYEKSGSIMPISNIEAVFANYINAGWEIAPYQPDHPRNEKFGTLIGTDLGNEFPFIAWKNAGWEIQHYQPQHRFLEKFGTLIGTDLGNQGQQIAWLNSGWEVQPVQPPSHINFGKRFAAFAPYPNIEIIFTFVPPPPVTELHSKQFINTVGPMMTIGSVG